MSLEEKQLEEKLKGLQIDMGNIARVIAETVKKDKQQVLDGMLNRTTLYPEQALEYGLVHEIKSELVEPGSEVISIQMTPAPPAPARGTANTAESVPIILVENG